MNINTIKFILETSSHNNMIIIDYDADRPLTFNLNDNDFSFHYNSVIIRGYNNNGIIVIDSEAIKSIRSFISKIDGALMEEQIEMEV